MTTTRQVFQVTVWGRPSEPMPGHGTYGEWLRTEINRWQTSIYQPRDAWAQENKQQVVLPDGYVAERGEAVAMFSWAEYQRPVGEEGQ